MADSSSGYPRCPNCTKDAEYARSWGCFEATPDDEPAYHIDCIWCSGRNEDCPHCGGTNRVPYHRCPNVLVNQPMLEMVSAVALVEHGVLPEPGGWNDQASTFCQAHPIVASRIGHEREAAMQKAANKNKARKGN